MAEDRKKVWDKVREAYLREVELTKQNTIDTGQLHRMDTTLSKLMEVQRAFQKECKPLSNERFAMFHRWFAEDSSMPRTQSPLWQEMMRCNVIAAVAEMMELLETTPWKPWKTYKEPMSPDQVWEAKLEIVDTLCFMMNCWMLLGGDGDQLAHLYLAKMKENHARQRGGY